MQFKLSSNCCGISKNKTPQNENENMFSYVLLHSQKFIPDLSWCTRDVLTAASSY